MLNPTAFLPFKHTAFTFLGGGKTIKNCQKSRSPLAMLGPCWHYVGSLFALGRILAAFFATCCVLLPLLAAFGASRHAPGSIFEGFGSLQGGFCSLRRCFLNFYAVCALALSQCSGCSKTKVLMGRNTLRKHCAPRPKSQKIAGRAFRNQQPT